MRTLVILIATLMIGCADRQIDESAQPDSPPASSVKPALFSWQISAPYVSVGSLPSCKVGDDATVACCDAATVNDHLTATCTGASGFRWAIDRGITPGTEPGRVVFGVKECAQSETTLSVDGDRWVVGVSAQCPDANLEAVFSGPLIY